MMNFFEKNQQLTFDPNHCFMTAINNLDSQCYTLERVRNPNQNYINNTYYLTENPHILFYYTCWMEEEAIPENIQSQKVGKKKPSSMIALLNKKNKGRDSVQNHKINLKCNKQSIPAMMMENIMYIQLECFSEVNIPSEIQDIKQFICIIYVLGLKVAYETNQFPCLIPVQTEDGRFKFFRKGCELNIQLANLFLYVREHRRKQIINLWSAEFAEIINKLELSQNKKLLGEYIKQQLEIIQSQVVEIKVKQGNKFVTQIGQLHNYNEIKLDSKREIPIDQFNISFTNVSEVQREVVLQNDFFDPIILRQNRGNFLIKYLKQLRNK